MTRTILHTESSTGWGGQEMRILKESLGMRERGYNVILSVVKGGQLAERARREGFTVYELPFSKTLAWKSVSQLVALIRKHQVDIINTHSSMDAWLGGIAGKMARRPVLRTRHLSTAIRKGMNSVILYRGLADAVVTTSSCIIPMICKQAGIEEEMCRCIATGIDPEKIFAKDEDITALKEELGLQPDNVVVGTACVLRSWKGINELLRAAAALRHLSHIKWLIVGGGNVERYRQTVREWDLDEKVFLTGHLDNPYPALKVMDIFALLSTANEGISQASLQAGYLGLPLVTTSVGGLPEVCIEGETGFVVPPYAAAQVAAAVERLACDPTLRKEFGNNARALVLKKYTMMATLDEMEKMYHVLYKS